MANFEQIFDGELSAEVPLINDKTRVWKSHATVPLSHLLTCQKKYEKVVKVEIFL